MLEGALETRAAVPTERKHNPRMLMPDLDEPIVELIPPRSRRLAS